MSIEQEKITTLTSRVVDHIVHNALAEIFNSFVNLEWQKNADKIATEATRQFKAHQASADEIAELSEADFLTLVKKQYKKTFEQDNWPAIKANLLPYFIENINSYKPSEILQQFLARHEWLKEGVLNGDDVIPKKFLTLIVHSLMPVNVDLLTTLKALETHNYRWSSLDANDLSNKIEGYPLKVSSYYDKNKSRLSHQCKDLDVPAWPLHEGFWRLDLIRFLNQSQAMQAKYIKGIYCTQIAALIFTELENLKPFQWYYLQTLFINMGSELSPCWILMNKQAQGTWIAYFPKNEAVFPFSIQECTEKLKNFYPCTIEYLAYEENCQLNNVDLIALTAWHIVLLGRVFPWTQQKPSLSLDNFRKNVPLSLMHEAVLLQDIFKTEDNNNIANKVTTAFSNRYPLSKFKMQSLEVLKPAEMTSLLSEPQRLLLKKRVNAEQILNDFDKAIYTIDSTLTRLEVQNKDAGHLTVAQMLSYHNPSLRSLKIEVTADEDLLELNKNLFEYNITLKTIHLTKIPAENSIYHYAKAIAARNRFLAADNDQAIFALIENNTLIRKKLWSCTGRQIASLFKEKLLNLDEVQQLQAFNKPWRAQNCTHLSENQLTRSQWQFAQIAQMGTDGLKALFDYLNLYHVQAWDPINKEPGPHLNATFDLAASEMEKPIEYLSALAIQIAKFDKLKAVGGVRAETGCTPLFDALALILPALPTNTFNEQLNNLLQYLKNNQDKLFDPDSELVLYNLSYNASPGNGGLDTALTTTLLTFLENLADKGLKITIRFPEWDREPLLTEPARGFKDYYRRIQNKILDNKRLFKQPLLSQNTAAIYAMDTDIPASVAPLNREAQLPQKWEGEDIVYPLGSVIPGLQIQLNQELEQSQEQVQQEEQEEAHEQEQEIFQYLGNEGVLISRETIDEKCYQLWEEIPLETKHFSGWKIGEPLKKLFSLWVGSHQNAPQVIERMEPAAVEKLMQFAGQFRLSIVKENLPAGFFVARSSKGGLILGYSELGYKQDVRARAAIASRKQNPFTIELYESKPSLIFNGDLRQLASFDNTKNTLNLWSFIAQEEGDLKTIENEVNAVNALGLSGENAKAPAVIIRGLEAAISLDTILSVSRENYENALAQLSTWAQQSASSIGLKKIELEFLTLLFDKNAKTALTLENLKAFGQLFNHYDAKDQLINGSRAWLLCAYQVWKQFGGEHFSIWKTRLLDNSKNWSELLDKTQIDALTLSIHYLRKKDLEQKLWWKLVDSHGKATGSMRYDRLWHSFQKLLTYLKVRKLTLNYEHFEIYLTQTANFNGMVFLERLYYVLQKTSKNSERKYLETQIVNNIHRIDWSYSGFYYAQRFNELPYWLESLQLNEFHSTIIKPVTDYRVTWFFSQEIGKDQQLTHALRYASQYIPHLSLKELERLERLLKAVVDQGINNPSIIRMLLSAITCGRDSINNLETQQITEITSQLANITESSLAWISECLVLDASELASKLYAHFEDFINIGKVLDSHPSYKLFLKKDLEFINACGRTLEFAKASLKGSEANFNAMLLQAVEKFNLSEQQALPSSFLYAPWLMNLTNEQLKEANFLSHEPQHDELKKLLLAIDFKKSTHLPSLASLEKVSEQLLTSNVAEGQILTAFIKIITDEGSVFDFQNTQFRKLNSSEVEAAMSAADIELQPNFKKENGKLLVRLLEQHIAVVDGKDIKNQLAAFLELLLSIDNKIYHNDLGSLLGLLIHKLSHQEKLPLYSIVQLSTWIKSFIDEATIKSVHYSPELIGSLLDDALKNPQSSLLNNNLSYLRKEISPEQVLKQLLIKNIISSPLSSACKPHLLRLVLTTTNNADLLFIEFAHKELIALDKKLSERLLKAYLTFLHLVLQSQVDNKKDFFSILTEIPEGCSLSWESMQHQLIANLANGKMTYSHLKELRKQSSGHYPITPQTSSIRAIITSLRKDWDSADELKLIENVAEYLKRCSSPELELLANYYLQPPYPSLKILLNLFKRTPTKPVSELLHLFETDIQANDEAGNSKRIYSIEESERANLYRIIAGMKQKGRDFIEEQQAHLLVNLLFYMNSYSLAVSLESISLEILQNTLQKEVALLHACKANDTQRPQLSARILACMREITLRKSGKWANHTQMIALLYAALSGEESLLYQIRTGQGKSIITMMRNAYLACEGYICDLSSAKESLSQRDHEEFAPVWDAMQIRHAYIVPHSSPDAYHSMPTDKGIGAINCATMGNFGLYFSGQVWDNEASSLSINFKYKKRVAFMDECDHILNDDTQLNYSDSEDNDAVYNMDAWIYSISYDFYLENKDKFPQNEAGILTVTRNKHLKELLTQLQQHQPHSPKFSTYFAKYLTPALSNDPRALKLRDEKLQHLLTAAHIASGLKQDINFSIHEELRVVAQGARIRTRFAKVMIDNQVREGSTYSELVQQFLHTRLNKEAAAKGEAPDFFIEPETQIALSLNAPFILNKLYSRREGCSGTAGNHEDLKRYRKKFGIKKVLKLPTHEPLNTNFLATIYCENEALHIQTLAQRIKAFSDRPILITCEDDIAVKRIYHLLMTELKEPALQERLIKDTNDSGVSEKALLPKIGKNGAVTLSARMKRGTNIKPESPQGLALIRSYKAPPVTIKQERGRQGRNGAPGSCEDIINYSNIQQQLTLILQPSESAEFKAIYLEQEKHLQEKLKKHEQRGSTKWNWITDKDLQVKYLNTRACVQFQQANKLRKERYLREKEQLIAHLSGEVLKVLAQYVQIKKDSHPFKKAWLECLKDIESYWKLRLAGKIQETEDVFAQFFYLINQRWKAFCSLESSLSSNLLFNLCDKVPLLEFSTSKEEFIKDSRFFWGVKASTHSLTQADKKRIRETCQSLGEHSVDQSEIELLQYLKLLESRRPKEKKKLQSPCSNASRLENMSALLGLYQEWLKGAKHHYYDKKNQQLKVDPHFFTAIYGENLRSLNYLFSTLYGISQLTVNREEKIKQHEKLFQFLALLFKDHSACFCISAAGMAELIKDLESHLLEDLVLYMGASQRFFNQKWLKNKVPLTFKERDIEKNTRLLETSWKIVKSHQLIKEKGTLNFIEYFGASIYKCHWKKWDKAFANYLLECFNNPKVAFLLTQHCNEADLGKFIQLINKHYRSDPVLSKRYIDNFNSYFQTHYERLNAHPSSIRSIIELLLGDFGLRNELPLPDCLDTAYSEPTRARFWHFLTQRQPINKQHCDKLLEFMDDLEDKEEAEKVLVLPLLALPAHLSLAHIYKTLVFTRSKAHNHDISRQINLLTTQGKSISNLKHAIPFVDENSFYKITKAWEKAQHSSEFVTNAKETFRNFQQFERIYSSNSKIATLVGDVVEAVSSGNTEPYNFFFTQANHAKNNEIIPELGKINAEALGKIKQGQFNSDLYLEKVKAKRQLQIFKKQFPACSLQLLRSFNVNIDLTKTPAVYEELFKELNRSEHCELKENIVPLCENWLSRATPPPLLLVKEALTYMHKAKQFAAGGNYAELFERADKNKITRQKIMQYAHHKFLTPPLIDQCFKEYDKFLQREWTLEKAKTYKGSRLFHRSYLQMGALAKELQGVAVHPFDARVALDTNPALVLADLKEKYTKEFQEMEKKYRGMWGWKSTIRKMQANTLFSNLKEATAHDSKADYYNGILNNLWKSQQQILKDDKATTQNKKGYSRLYNISMALFVKVAFDYLKDTEIGLTAKQKLAQDLQAQFDYQFTLLKERLPAGKFKTELSKLEAVPLQEGDASFKDLTRILLNLRRNEVPEHLLYLTDNLTCYVDLAAAKKAFASSSTELSVKAALIS